MNFDHGQSDTTKSGIWAKFVNILSHGFSMVLEGIFQQRILPRSWKTNAFGSRFQEKGDVNVGESLFEAKPARYHLFGNKSMKVDISVECSEPKGYSKLIELMKKHTYNK